MLLLGAHMSISGGLHNAISPAIELGCSCFQMFVKNQRQWNAAKLSDKAVADWNKAMQSEAGSKIEQVIVHSGYLINLASDSEEIREKSKKALLDELLRCKRLGIDKLVLHPGSHRDQGVKVGMELVTAGLQWAIEQSESVNILLETTAGAGSSIGSSIEQIAELIDTSKYSDRLGCCLDTCHLFAAGYELSPDEKLEELLASIDKQIGLSKIGCIHLNDSKGKVGGHLDRHEQIGKGEIGEEPFRYIMRHPKLENVVKIIETPKGEDKNGNYDDRNLSLLREMVK
jgi:deoxyribonuclease IV